MSLVKSTKNRVGIASELMQFLWARKMWWMIPMVFVLLVFGGLMVTAASTPLGPFIYTLF